MEMSIGMLSQIFVLAATGCAALYTLKQLCAGTRDACQRDRGGHGRTRRA